MNVQLELDPRTRGFRWSGNESRIRIRTIIPLVLPSPLLRGLQLTRFITGIIIVPEVVSVSFRIVS